MVSNVPPKRILAVILEFEHWSLGRAWSYLSSYAILDGLDSCGIDYVVLPSLFRPDNPTSNPWLAASPAFLAGETFDQAWVWITHSHHSDAFWAWLHSVAPIRVGVLMESLRYTPDEIADSPQLAGRFERVAAELKHMTHVLSYDECDVTEIAERTGLPTRLYHNMIPRTLVTEEAVADGRSLLFLGSLYAKRQRFLAREQLGDLLEIVQAPETEIGYGQRFDDVNATFLDELVAGRSSKARMQEYAAALRAIRRDVLTQVFQVYRSGFAMLNLPALFKGFPGRVLEGIAAGVPVLTCRPTDRPQTERLFTEGREILFYDEAVPGDLRRCAERLRGDPQLRSSMVANGRRKVLEHLTSEIQVRELLDWIGRTPRRGGFGRLLARTLARLHG